MDMEGAPGENRGCGARVGGGYGGGLYVSSWLELTWRTRWGGSVRPGGGSIRIENDENWDCMRIALSFVHLVAPLGPFVHI
jgi:hypothetical protein